VTKDASELVAAAAAFDVELAAYARLGELFVRTPLDGVKHIERANGTLGEIAACEERLQVAGQRLIAALTEARGRQEGLAADVVAHVPALQARNQLLQAHMMELGALAQEVGALNQTIAGHNGTAAGARELADQVSALADKAAALSTRAHGDQLEEVAVQAHALHQKLDAVAKKLGKAGANV
jgi:septal ring factor EnvC (AmiA/AmiB activator)